MPKKSCCCKPGTDTSFCCNPILFKEFISLYGTDMSKHAEVSPKDWIALYVPRPKTVFGRSRRTVQGVPVTCNTCGCECRNNTVGDRPELLPEIAPGSILSSTNPFNPVKVTVTNKIKNTFNNFFGSKSDKAGVKYKSKGFSNVDNPDYNDAFSGAEDSQENYLKYSVRGAGCYHDRCLENPSSSENCLELDRLCNSFACKGDFLDSYSPGCEPIVFAYKYSGCNFIWWPREYTFGHNPYVPQCTGLNTRRASSDPDGPGERQNSCQSWAPQREWIGAGFDSGCQKCYSVGLDEEERQNGKYPCACVPFPHIHGGVLDSVFNRVNVKISPGQLGYAPLMNPFSPGMLVSEADCCWCASTAPQNWKDYSDARNSCFSNTYPYYDQKGKTVGQSSPCELGINCYYNPGETANIAKNPKYRRSCFEWSISPYLLRISKDRYPAAYEIWRHGRESTHRHDFGPYYYGASVVPNDLQKDLKIKFRKVSGVKTNLLQQYIGFVQLEHHFENYAFRGTSGIATINILPVQNHASLLITPFERPYSGQFTTAGGSSVRWQPWKYDSNLWQIRRGVPRRVMYQSSGVPLFHFDLVSMEVLSQQRGIAGPGGGFDGAKFLEHYYRYFFAMKYYESIGCRFANDPNPEPMEWNYGHLLESRDYVRGWLELMVVHKILRIKDHAIDISADVNDIIKTGSYVTTPEGTQEITIPDTVSQLVGGVSGYQDIINFFGVQVGQENATTPKLIKQKLLNTEGLTPFLDTSAELTSMNCFLPRKATLPLAYSSRGITAWGCVGDTPPLTQYDGISCAAYIINAKTVPSQLNTTDPNNGWSTLNPLKVVCGMAGTFLIDSTGKILLFGGYPESGPYDRACNDDGTIQYPTSITCIPYYASVINLFRPPIGQNPVPQDPTLIPDGKIVDLAFKGFNCVMSLMDFETGGLGYECSESVDGSSVPENRAAESYGNQSYAQYCLTNCNGENTSLLGDSVLCLPYEPFYNIQAGLANIRGPRGNEDRPGNAFRIKSWGSESKKATFSLSQEDAVNTGVATSRGYDPEINESNLRYPGTNTWFIWTKVACGLKHYCALDDYGGVFVTPLSDNTHKQSEKGIPLTYQQSRAQGYNGFGRGFNYFNHIPRPGYVKEEEWNLDFYRHITNSRLSSNSYRPTACACPFQATDDQCRNTNTGPGGGGSPLLGDCFSVVIKDQNCQEFPENQKQYDQTCILFGSLVDDTLFEPTDSQPRYVNLAAGHFNTLLLSNENKLEIHGKYYQIDEVGEIIGPVVTENINGADVSFVRGITAFIPPVLENLKGTWDVTYGCPVRCEGITHSPILGAIYNRPSESSIITQIESSADYSIAALKSNVVYVWGDASMVPGVYNPSSYKPGDTGYIAINLQGANGERVNITSIAAGVNAFYISYNYLIEGTDYSVSKMYSFTRYAREDHGLDYPTYMQTKTITDISAGFGHAVAIFSDGLETKNWDYQSFAPDTLKYQYKNWNSIPKYFKRDAFFHAIQGGWDFSKWLYGGNCCQTLSSDNNHPIVQSDTCSALAYNIYKQPTEDGYFNQNLSYSGHPQDFWHRPDWRRLTQQGFGYFYSFPPSEGNPDGCDPDGTDIASQGGGAVSQLFASCLKNQGSVWAEGRPACSGSVIREKTKIEPACYRPGQANCQNREVYFRGIIPDFDPSESLVQVLSVSVDIPPAVSYRATKDIFQMMTVRYGLDGYNNSIGSCVKHIGTAISYFKYSERHYYFGYDVDSATWDIYENPDFLRDIDPDAEYTCDGNLDSRLDPIGGCTIGSTYYGPFPGGGFGGGGTGGSSYYSLIDYPMTGPNYAREERVQTPSYLLNNMTVYKNLYSVLCNLDPDGDSSPCYSCGVNPGSNASDVIGYFAGPGAFLWKRICEGGYPTSSGLQMYARYYHNPRYIYTKPISYLLYGVSNIIDHFTPPDSDPNYSPISFIDVLKNSNYTSITQPWKSSASSTKWLPLFLESKNYFPSPICGLVGDQGPIAFAGFNEQESSVCEDGDGQTCIVVRCLGQNNPIFTTTPVLCNIFDCCPPILQP